MRTYTRILGALLVGACGGGAGDRSGPVADVPAERLLSGLDAEEAVEVCDALEDHAVEVIGEQTLLAYQCTLLALEESVMLDSDLRLVLDQAACEAARSACLNGSPERFLDCDELDDPFPECDATVGELLSCLGTAIRESKSAYAAVECRIEPPISDPNLALSRAVEESDACAPVRQQCPGAYVASAGDGN